MGMLGDEGKAAGIKQRRREKGALTKKLLEEYKSKKAEIHELEQGLLHLNDNNAMMISDTILNYNSGYPVPESVTGVDWDKVYRTESIYKKKIETLSRECAEVEEFIESISDSITRRIFRMYYVNGLSQSAIARRVHMSQTAVSKKISHFFKME